MFETEVAKGKAETTRVRFIITEGEMPSPEFIEKRYNTWTGRDKPAPAGTSKGV